MNKLNNKIGWTQGTAPTENSRGEPCVHPIYKKAFTLVELIVVITILAILWTIGFMSFQR
jgi:prepilin-type N-terminal cleavage/methylation domain-containing protein